MVQVSLSTSTTFDGDLNALVEDQGTALTVRLDLDEPAPPGGLKVYIDSDVEQILNRLDLPAAISNPQFENLNLFSTQTNFDNSGLAIEVSAGATFATVTLNIFDNVEPDTFLPATFDGLVETVFSLVTADQIAPEDATSITGVGDYTIDPDAASSTVLFVDDVSQLPGDPTPPAAGYDEAVSGDISNDPNSPLVLDIAEGTTRLSASTGNGDQEYVTVTVAEGFQLDSLVLESFAQSDVAFIGVQEGTTFTEPLDNSAVLGEFLGYTLFGTSAVGTDILDNIGNGSNGANFGGQGFEGPLPTGTYTFAIQQLDGPSDYTLAFNVTEATVEPPTDPPTDPPAGLPVVSFEAVPATISEEASVEDRLLRLEFTVAGEIPEGGLVVLLENLFGITDQADSEAEGAAFEGLGLAPPFDQENNIIGIRLLENQAAIQLPMINDLVEETTTFDFRLLEGEGYVVDPDQNATLFTITDDNGGPGIGPTIGLSVSETNLAEGDTLTVNFAVDGEIPPEGIDVLVLSDESVAGPLGQFELSDLSALQLSGVSNLRPGDDRGQSFIATLTDVNASITLDIFDDIVAEEPIEIPFALANGELYEVDPNAANVVLTISDEPQPVGPTVGISLDKTDVVEGETITLSFTVDGDIPAEGLTVLVNDNDGVRSLTEFDIAGVELSDGIAGFPTPAEGDSGFFVTLTQATASITLPVLDDGADEDEAAEVFTFEVIDGEAYEVDLGAGSVTLNIADAGDVGGGGDLSVSLDVLAGTFTADDSGIDTLITPNLLLDGSGTPILSLLLSADGPVPEEGVVVNVQSDLADISQFIVNSNFVPTAFGGEVLGAIYDDAGSPTGLQVRLDNRNTVVTFNTGFALPTDGTSPETVNFSLAEGEGYTPVDTIAAATVYSDASQLPPPADPVEIGVSFDGGVLTEGGEFGTLNFTVDGEIPPEGVIVFVSNNQFAGIVDFDLLNAITTGGSFPAPDGNAGGFFFKITEPTASISFQARVDEEIEGLEQVNIALQPLVGYTIAEDASEVAVLVQEGDNSLIQASLAGEPEVLIEAEGTVATVNINLSAPPPLAGIEITIDAAEMIEFNPQTLSFSDNIQPVSANEDNTSFTIRMFEQTGSLSVAVADDGEAEGLETAVFTIAEPGADAAYQVNPEANTATFTIVDTAEQIPAPGVEDTESNDTIATATATGLTADNSTVSVDGRIRGNFFDSDLSLRTDLTEDVDIYSFDLGAGDTVRIDTDSAVFDSGLDTVLRVFDANGEQLAQSDDDFAPDELFAPGRRDSYVEFTATDAGTYYVGVSSFGNGLFDFFLDDEGNPTNAPYDPNVAGSGTGRSFGDYTLNFTLNEEIVAAATDIPASTGEGPTVSLAATPATYAGDDSLLANALVQFVEDGSASILTLGLEVDGDIPEGGIEVFLTSNLDLTSVFSSSTPFSPGGAEVLGAVYDETGTPIGLRVNLLSSTAILNLNLDSPEEAPTDGLEEVTFTLEPAAGYAVGTGTFSAPIYDTLADVPALPTVPTVSVSLSETALVESEGNTTTLTFELDAPPPEGGVVVNVDSGVRAALGEFNVFDAEIVGGNFPSPNFRASGFFFNITEQTATITLSAFDETTNPDIPAEDALEGIDELTFTVQPGVGYAIAPDAGAVTVTIADNPDSVPLPGDGDGDGNGDGDGSDEPVDPVEVELNDTIAAANPVELPTDGSTTVIEGEIGTTRATRNLIDRSEDVDMYAFDLEAGQTLVLDIDGGGTGDAGVAGSLLDNILRIFDAVGNELAIVENAAAPDEIFQANGDAYIEFTAPETGTYYAGISNLGNNFYDPNVAGSGSGWTFIDAFEPGAYRLEASLAEATGPLPTVTLTATPEIASEDSSQTITVTWTIDGDIPEGGLPVVIGGDFATLFDPELRLLDESLPFTTEPADGLIPLENRGTEFVVGLTAPVVSASVVLFDDILEEEPLDLNFAVLEDDGYLVGGDGIATVTVVDGDSVTPGSGPTVSLSVSETALNEGDELTVNFAVDGEIPEGGLTVFVDGPPAAISEFDIFGDEGIDPATDLVGLAGFPEADNDAGGFLATLTENQASITLSVFDDGPTEGEESLTFELRDGEAYEVAADASTATLTINDGGEAAVFAVESGVTSVFLDFPLLEEVAGLTLVSADSEATPAERPAFLEPFQVGFAITEATDFTFAPVPFTPLGGTIEHSGTITLGLGDAEATIGEFSIGFDESRVSETTSGFFLADTLDDALGLEILFDLSAPGTASVSNNELEISGTDLLLSPELATALGLSDLAGADVGDAQVDALVALTDGGPVGPSDVTDGDDVLMGTDGADVLDGLLGSDTYTGGEGADQFVFSIAQGIDTITDFEVGVDQISLGGLTPAGIRTFEMGSDTLVLTNSNELIGIVAGVTGLDSSAFA